MKLLMATALILFAANAFAHDFDCADKTAEGMMYTSISSFPHILVAQSHDIECTGQGCNMTSPKVIADSHQICGMNIEDIQANCKTDVMGSDEKSFMMDVNCPSVGVEFMVMIENGAGYAHCMQGNNVVKEWDFGACKVQN